MLYIICSYTYHYPRYQFPSNPMFNKVIFSVQDITYEQSYGVLLAGSLVDLPYIRSDITVWRRTG